MIQYNYETNFLLDDESLISDWIERVILNADKKVGEINYIFCNDEYLHKINVEFLQHDNFTDIISFDYTMGNIINGDLYISIDRVKENSVIFDVKFIEELNRVMIHGILHYLGWQDKTEQEKSAMRNKENECLILLNN